MLAALFAVGATSAAPASAASTTGTLVVSPTDLGQVQVDWNLLGNGGTTSELLEGDRVVDREVDTTPGVGAGIGGGDAKITIPDSELYGTTPIAFSLRILNDDGSLVATSPTVTVGPCVNIPPRANAPFGATVDAFGANFARIHWNRGQQDVCHAAPTGYAVTANGVTTTVPTTSATLSGLTPATKYDVSIVALPTSTVQPEAPTTASLTTDPGTDTTPPTKPGAPTATNTSESGNRSFTVTWGASTDDVAVAGYDVYTGTTLLTSVAGNQTSARVLSLPKDAAVPITVVARDQAGNVSPASDPVTVNACGFGPPHVYSPTGVVASDITPNGATVNWNKSTTAACQAVSPIQYLVYVAAAGQSATLAGTVTSDLTKLAVTGLSPGQTYTVTVTASGFNAATSQPIQFTTVAPPPVTQATTYAVKGTATLKNLVKGSLPLTGSLASTLDTSTGALSGDLSLNQTTANLKVLGFLPVTAKVNLTSTAPVTGQLTGTNLSAVAKVRIKLPVIKTAGIQLAGGSNCQAAQVSTIALSSVGAFTPLTSGTLAGTFSISNLTGCGILNGIVSPLTAGSGNAITLNLGPVPPPTA